MLSALPWPNLLEEFQFKIIIRYHDSVHECLYKLGFFESPNFLDKFRDMFPNAKLIKIILGTRTCPWEKMLFEASRRLKSLRELEEIGIVKFDFVKHVNSCR